jgi:crotonobetainyl-CoA:carnitine CoA-transferase CaiB-like acyl-CoA transferase
VALAAQRHQRHKTLAAANPGLMMRRTSGHGQTGPCRDLRGCAANAEAPGALRRDDPAA